MSCWRKSTGWLAFAAPTFSVSYFPTVAVTGVDANLDSGRFCCRSFVHGRLAYDISLVLPSGMRMDIPNMHVQPDCVAWHTSLDYPTPRTPFWPVPCANVGAETTASLELGEQMLLVYILAHRWACVVEQTGREGWLRLELLRTSPLAGT